MIEDANSLPDGHSVTADIAIIGAGAAGIVLAHELANSALRVVVLESGSLEPEASIQSLNDGSSSGHPTFPLISSRLRYFGGTTNHWTGQCAPLDPIDFTARDWIAHSGWPMGRDELDPFYVRASHYAELGGFEAFDVRTAQRSTGYPVWEFTDGRLQHVVYQQSPPTRFGQAWRKPLAEADDIEVYLNATVVELVADARGQRLSHLAIRTQANTSLSVRARRYVLASGGIENARLLLVSRGIQRNGLGNNHDLVGRFFMDHLVLYLGDIAFSQPDSVDGRFYNYWSAEEYKGFGALRVAEQLLVSQRLLNAGLIIRPRPANEVFRDSRRTDSVNAFISVARSVSRGEFPNSALEDSCTIIDDPGPVSAFMARRFMRKFNDHGGYDTAPVVIEAEQSPNRASRVTLTEERDHFGVPRAHLDWQIATGDFESIATTERLLALSIGASGLGRFRSNAAGSLEAHEAARSAWHHMGTTRMATTPQEGVVDSNCRVFDVENLFVAGSSVFPTGGRSNPTLTIVALAIRLAHYLKGELAA